MTDRIERPADSPLEARYLLFRGESYYPDGGPLDLFTWNADPDALIAFARLVDDDDGWWCVFDVARLRIIESSSPPALTDDWTVHAMPMPEWQKVCGGCGQPRTAVSDWPECDRCEPFPGWVAPPQGTPPR